MGLFTKDIKSMEDLLLHGLQDIYYAEQQILKALPKMIDKATNRDLATGLKAHLDETNKQVERLDKVFAKLGKAPTARRSTGWSRRRTQPPARSRTSPCWMQPSSPMRKPSSTTKFPGMAP